VSLLVLGCARSYVGGPFEQATVRHLQHDVALADLLEAVVPQRDLVIEHERPSLVLYS
jgi:hypothetical protein